MRNEDKDYNLIVAGYHFILDLSHNNELIFTKCFSDIPPGNNWILYVYDGGLTNVSDTCSNPAVILTDITITGRISIEPSKTSTVIYTSISDSISEAPSIKGNDLHYIMYYCQYILSCVPLWEEGLAMYVYITISLFKFIKQLIYLSLVISITTISTDISQYYNNEFTISGK